MSLAKRVIDGEIRAAARLMRDLDDRMPGVIDQLRAIYPHTGRAYLIGITGNPGSGKSTLGDRLLTSFRAEGKTVGVVAVDPTSPFTGGAILGDRIRMQRHAADPEVFIRSVATRGHLGGLSRSAADIARVMDAMGKDIVILETVGVGQDEVEIAKHADTTVVVTVPGLGDDVQAIKAGILEIADVFVVNKADRDGSDRTVRELEAMLALRGTPPGGWKPPVVKTIAAGAESIDEFRGALEDHRAYTVGRPDRRELAMERARHELLQAARDCLVDRIEERIRQNPEELSRIVEQVAARETDPFTAATGWLDS